MLEVPVEGDNKANEILDLGRKHPDLLRRAIAMEDGARDGKHGLTKINGLGMALGQSWRSFCEDKGLIERASCGATVKT